MADCLQLSQQIRVLKGLLTHVSSPAARQNILQALTRARNEQAKIGCLKSQVSRTLSGTATLCANRFLDGTRVTQVSLVLRKYTWASRYSLALGSEGGVLDFGGVRVGLDRSRGDDDYRGGYATVDDASGEVHLQALLEVTGLPLVGSVRTDVHLWTGNRFDNAPCGTVAGVSADPAGKVALAGTTEISALGQSIQAWLLITGELSPAMPA
jgi:hypothetical protein